MNHQPFDTWLLADEPLTPQEHRALHTHLQTCHECRALQSAWQEVLYRFREAPEPLPAAGFTARWQQRWQNLQRQAEKRRALLLIAINLGGMGSILLLFLLLLGVWFDSPLGWLLMLSKQFALLLTLLEAIGRLLSLVAAFVPLSWWVVLLQAGLFVLALWVCSVQKFLLPRRVSS